MDVPVLLGNLVSNSFCNLCGNHRHESQQRDSSSMESSDSVELEMVDISTEQEYGFMQLAERIVWRMHRRGDTTRGTRFNFGRTDI